MISIKQIFIILSVMSLASGKKGISARNTRVEGERRGLKKASKRGNSGGYLGGGSGVPINGVNRDGSIVGSLIEPGHDCVPFDEANKWITADYPGDTECRIPMADLASPVPTSACCRVFDYQDTNGSQKWLLYDSNNQYRDLMCVCNQNTATGTGVIDVPGGMGADVPGGMGGDVPGGADRDGETGGNPIGGLPTPSPAPSTTTAPGPNQCSKNEIGQTQLSLQDSPYMVPCEDSSPCGTNKCCFSNYCVCWPVSQLVPGTSYCL